MKRTATVLLATFAAVSLGFSAQQAANLMPNSNFDDSENPLKYWTVAYPNNQNYIDNHLKYVSLLPDFGGKKNVLRLMTNKDIGYGGFERWMLGAQADSPLIPFEQGCRYRFTFNIMATTAYHIYAVGYSFKPGLKPYEHPVLDDMRMRYKGGICEQTAKKGAWTKVEYDWPEKQLSDKAIQILKTVSMMSLHIINITGVGDVYFKDLVVTKLPDGYTGGKITADTKKPEQAGPAKTGTGRTTRTQK